MAIDKGFEEKLRLLDQEISTLTGAMDRTGEVLSRDPEGVARDYQEV